jgi:hypothetical protein
LSGVTAHIRVDLTKSPPRHPVGKVARAGPMPAPPPNLHSPHHISAQSQLTADEPSRVDPLLVACSLWTSTPLASYIYTHATLAAESSKTKAATAKASNYFVLLFWYVALHPFNISSACSLNFLSSFQGWILALVHRRPFCISVAL